MYTARTRFFLRLGLVLGLVFTLGLTLGGCADREPVTAASILGEPAVETGPLNASETLPDGTVRRYRMNDDGTEQAQ